jgi:peptidoglycan hydrolase-like protein with peptidoglycan-binding domain
MKTRGVSRRRSVASVVPVGLLQRQCSCGKSAGLTGDCGQCQSQRLITKSDDARQGMGAPILHEMIQPKLTIGAPNDQYEQEADRVSERVMRMPDAEPEEKEKEAEENVQTKPLTTSIMPMVQRDAVSDEGMVSGAIEGRLQSTKGQGNPLPDEVRSFMEPRFGVDLGDVRVHTGNAATQMNQELGAQAFTYGNDIYYGNGKTPGRNVLTAHELTHVLQQTGGVQTKLLEISNMSLPAIQRLNGPCPDTPPRIPHLLINQGSVHPDVRDAQRKLNLFHKQETSAGRPGLPDAPIIEDCIFGTKTHNATFAFQQKVFPGKPEEQDGKIGDKTWAELDKVSRTPTPPPPTPPPPTPTPPTPASGCKTATNLDLSGTTFNPTTMSENKVASRHPFDAIRARIDASTALSAAETSGLLGLHLGPADAFRHCLWNCLMTQHIGATRAEQFATGHENSGPSPIPFDNQMDLHDNATGRNLASSGADCQDACMKAVTSGELRTIRKPPEVSTACIGASDQPWP